MPGVPIQSSIYKIILFALKLFVYNNQRHKSKYSADFILYPRRKMAASLQLPGNPEPEHPKN